LLLIYRTYNSLNNAQLRKQQSIIERKEKSRKEQHERQIGR